MNLSQQEAFAICQGALFTGHKNGLNPLTFVCLDQGGNMKYMTKVLLKHSRAGAHAQYRSNIRSITSLRRPRTMPRPLPRQRVSLHTLPPQHAALQAPTLPGSTDPFTVPKLLISHTPHITRHPYHPLPPMHAQEDGSSLLRQQIAQGKAYGALTLFMDSAKLGPMAADRPAFVNSAIAAANQSGLGLVPVAGGVVVRRKSTGEVRCRWCVQSWHNAKGLWTVTVPVCAAAHIARC